MKNNSNTLRTKRSLALTIANQLKAEGRSFSEAQKIGWEIVRLKEALKNNIVLISFFKTNGEFTQRLATLNPSFMPKRKASKKGTAKKRSSIKVNYMEIGEDGKNFFKSFKPELLTGWSIAVDIKQTILEQVTTAVPAQSMTMSLQAA